MLNLIRKIEAAKKVTKLEKKPLYKLMINAVHVKKIYKTGETELLSEA